jgi:hypothetical protein
MKTVLACLLVLLSTALGAAADVTGKWAGDVPVRGGDMTPTTFTFKVDGNKLTGSMTGPQGEVPLQDGKVSGDLIAFSTTVDFGGNTVKIIYKGMLSGDQIKMTRQGEGGSGQAREFTLKRAGS